MGIRLSLGGGNAALGGLLKKKEKGISSLPARDKKVAQREKPEKETLRSQTERARGMFFGGGWTVVMVLEEDRCQTFWGSLEAEAEMLLCFSSRGV